MLGLAGKVVFAPCWVFWRMYLGLWWAFDDRKARAGDSPRPAAEAPPKPLPMTSLRIGFAATMLASLAVGGIAFALVHDNQATPLGGWLLWLWVTLLSQVGAIATTRFITNARARRAESRGLRRAMEELRAKAAAARSAADSPASKTPTPEPSPVRDAPPSQPPRASAVRGLWSTCRARCAATGQRCATAGRIYFDRGRPVIANALGRAARRIADRLNKASGPGGAATGA